MEKVYGEAHRRIRKKFWGDVRPRVREMRGLRLIRGKDGKECVCEMKGKGVEKGEGKGEGCKCKCKGDKDVFSIWGRNW